MRARLASLFIFDEGRGEGTLIRARLADFAFFDQGRGGLGT